jgi:hypothetical protein
MVVADGSAGRKNFGALHAPMRRRELLACAPNAPVITDRCSTIGARARVDDVRFEPVDMSVKNLSLKKEVMKAIACLEDYTTTANADSGATRVAPLAPSPEEAPTSR